MTTSQNKMVKVRLILLNVTITFNDLEQLF